MLCPLRVQRKQGRWMDIRKTSASLCLVYRRSPRIPLMRRQLRGFTLLKAQKGNCLPFFEAWRSNIPHLLTPQRAGILSQLANEGKWEVEAQWKWACPLWCRSFGLIKAVHVRARLCLKCWFVSNRRQLLTEPNSSLRLNWMCHIKQHFAPFNSEILTYTWNRNGSVIHMQKWTTHNTENDKICER